MPEDVTGLIAGAVTALLPLFLLGVPGFVLLGLVVVPLAAAAALVAIAAAILAAPYLLVRSVRRARAARRRAWARSGSSCPQ
jgi:hypothetical protein